jgi:hypothetical protein
MKIDENPYGLGEVAIALADRLVPLVLTQTAGLEGDEAEAVQDACMRGIAASAMAEFGLTDDQAQMLTDTIAVKVAAFHLRTMANQPADAGHA